MIEFLREMGIFLVPLLALSVYGVGLILAKYGQLAAARALKVSVFTELMVSLSRDDLAEARAMVSGKVTSVSHPFAVLIDYADEPPVLLQARAQVLLGALEDRLSYFPALANLATLSGLFGTVSGMIVSFLALRAGGGADPSALAGGIASALVATALGLVTAIPSLAAHAVFQKQVQALTTQMESLLAGLSARRAGIPHA